MKKSKIIFAVLAAVIALFCFLMFLLQPGSSDPGSTSAATTPFAETVAVTSTTIEEIETEDLPDFEIPTLPVETTPPIIVGSNVTIQQVEKGPQEVIDRSQVLDPSDPEYISVTGGDPYFNMEGKVCRNDKIISISLYDSFLEESFTVSFGHITGQCNRFLYLNPIVQKDGTSEFSFIRFDPASDGNLITIPGNPESENAFTCTLESDRKYFAQYTDPKHPGAVWFPQYIVDGPIYLDMAIYNRTGLLRAVLRLTIAKADDGTYALADIDNLDLLQDQQLHPEFTVSELKYVVETANNAWLDPALSKIVDDSLRTGFTINECLIEYRDSTKGFPYPTFIPTENTTENTKDYKALGFPVLAVTCRQTGSYSHTLYLLVVSPPTESQHGVYQYIGRDYPLNISPEA